ncbi:MAG: ABC transporter permease [Tannerella sp.]|jgi:ABC-type transport system involved in multi-copper enzyme maturation permease subunit|nr:ABC transporter permease [Tannerella sp.]
MFTTLYIRELQGYLYSLRFQISFIIAIVVFTVGSISFVTSIQDIQNNYAKYTQSALTELTNDAGNISKVAVNKRNYILTPRNNSVIADCKEEFLPNQYTYSAYNVFGFNVRHQGTNPYMSRADNLNWAFIVSMFFSFITLLFAFDSISGEKEDKTLALVFSNSVPRRIFIFSKLLSIITMVGFILLTGIVISLLIMAFSGKVVLNASFLSDTLGFICVSLLFISIFATFGLLSSVITRSSNVSLLLSLCFWLFVAVIIPNTSVFWAKKLFPIPSSEQIEQLVNSEKDDIRDNAPPGSMSYYGGKPFYPAHQLRADLFAQYLNSEKRIRDDYYRQMFRQFEKTRNFTLISPLAQFDYINEAFVGGGYLRFQKNWQDLHVFQEQFLQWFKELDAKDPDSPHWYNYMEDISTSNKPVSVDQIPQYQEQYSPFDKRILFVGGYIIAMVITIAVLLVLCFYFFVKYDVR